jgi:hypothetical protein
MDCAEGLKEKAREGGCRAFSYRAVFAARLLVREQHNNDIVRRAFLLAAQKFRITIFAGMPGAFACLRLPRL